MNTKKSIKHTSQGFLQEAAVSLQDDYKKKQSILLKVSLSYLLTTSIILAIFLVASSSNQMNLIAEKAIKTTDSTAYELFRRLEPLFPNSKWSLEINSEQNRSSLKEVKKTLKTFKGSQQLIVPNFKILSTEGNIFYTYNANNKKNKILKLTKSNNKKVPLSTIKDLKRAVTSKKISGQLFLSIPNIKKYYIEIILPMAIMKNNHNILFYTRVDMTSLKNEVNSIMRLAYALISLVFFTQFGLVYFLYRILLVPIKRLAEGAHNVAEGNLKFRVFQLKQPDELGQLTYLFNKMVLVLDERTTKLNSSIVELKKHNDIMQTELEMARNIQAGIMPQNSLYSKITFSIYYGPLEKVSGDYYDFFNLSNGALGILMTDASGHGIPAALVTIMAKFHFNEAAHRFYNPGDLLEYVNEQLVKSIITSDYITAFYMILDTDLTLRYSNASHQKAIIFQKQTGNVLELDSGGFFVGAIEDLPFKYENKKVQLEPKDRIILYTDGIVEGTNSKKEEYSTERFIAKIKEFSEFDIQTFNNKIIEDVDTFADGQIRKDDYTLLVVEIK